MPSLPWIVSDLNELAGFIEDRADAFTANACQLWKARRFDQSNYARGAAEEAFRIADMLRHTELSGGKP